MNLKVTKAYDVQTRPIPIGALDTMRGTTGAKTDDPDLVAGRAFFLVDKQGIVRGKWPGEDLAVFPTEVLLKAASEVAGKAGGADGEKPSEM